MVIARYQVVVGMLRVIVQIVVSDKIMTNNF